MAGQLLRGSLAGHGEHLGPAARRCAAGKRHPVGLASYRGGTGAFATRDYRGGRRHGPKTYTRSVLSIEAPWGGHDPGRFRLWTLLAEWAVAIPSRRLEDRSSADR